MRTIDIAQHCEEQIPGDTIEAKDSHSQAEATIARIEKMRLRALVRGQLIKLKPIMNGSEDLFKTAPAYASEDTPKLKMKDLLSEAYERRIRKAPG